MRESVGYTVTLNIAIVFIIVVFTFLSSALIYYKSNKASNIIINSIEKYEGYNQLSMQEIKTKMNAIGFSPRNVKCDVVINSGNDVCGLQKNINSSIDTINNCDSDDALCKVLSTIAMALQLSSNFTYLESGINEYISTLESAAGDVGTVDSKEGYCAYVCLNKNLDYTDKASNNLYYYYKIRTNMMINVPIINEILDIPIYSNTNNIYIYNRNFN